ncbi:MAG: flippase [Lachnospiraceae bacterium]|nr:flippase [Lachnospiraceae bacterium]
MNLKRGSLRYNFIMNTLLQGSAWLIPFAIRPYVSRILLPDGMGHVGFAISQLYYFILIATLGIPTYGIRECARVREDPETLRRTVREILCINLVMGAVAYALYFGYVFGVAGAEYRTLLLVISPAILLNVINVDWFYKGLEDFRTIAFRNVVVRLCAAIAILLMVKGANQRPLYGFLSILSSYGAGLWNLLGATRTLKRVQEEAAAREAAAAEKGSVQKASASQEKRAAARKRKAQEAGVKRHLRPILVFLGMSIATAIYTQLDVVMLGFLQNDIVVGIYDAAAAVKVLLVAAVTALGAVLLPRVSALLSKGQRSEFLRLSRKAILYVAAFGLVLMAGTILCRNGIILVMSGRDFAAAGEVLLLLAMTIPLIGYTNIVGMQMLVPLGREKAVLASEIAGAVTDFVLNLILIPGYGAAGAALATVLAECVVALWQTFCCRGELKEAFAAGKSA